MHNTRLAGAWPRLRVADWSATRDTLHMWTQIVGKIRLAPALEQVASGPDGAISALPCRC